MTMYQPMKMAAAEALTAAEYALMLTDGAPAVIPRRVSVKLSARERELVTLVAQGRANAQIAAELYISVCTVSSHLDRIRDKTGCRRRADLTVWPWPQAWYSRVVIRPIPL